MSSLNNDLSTVPQHSLSSLTLKAPQTTSTTSEGTQVGDFERNVTFGGEVSSFKKEGSHLSLNGLS